MKTMSVGVAALILGLGCAAGTAEGASPPGASKGAKGATARGAPPDGPIAAPPEVIRIAEGVWMLRHAEAPDGYPQGNTTVIAGAESALVVDSTYLPSTARADIKEIQKLTQRPVRYLINTHWHPDHTRGNPLYAEAFPGLLVLANTEMIKLMHAYEPGNLARYPVRIADYKQKLATGLDAAQKPLSAEAREEAATMVPKMERVLAEYQGYSLRYPDVGLRGALELDLGGRTVLLESEHADTGGDVIASLPAEKLVVTGDILSLPMPYFFASNLNERAGMLEELARREPALVVPGHGPLLQGSAGLAALSGLIRTVQAQVNAEVEKRGSISAKLEDVTKVVEVSAFRQRIAGDDKQVGADFDQRLPNLIRLAWLQAPK